MRETVPVKYILYADDDTDDQEIMLELLPQIVPYITLVIKENGLLLIDFLNNLREDEDAPVLIILDLNMPACDGIETLSSIKNIRRFNLIPIIIFSTTDNEQDRNRALSAGAVAFVTKPSSFRELEVLIESFTTFFV